MTSPAGTATGAGMTSPASMPTPVSTWRHPGTWTLRAKLLVSMLLLFAVIAGAIGTATVVTLNRYLTTTTDQNLRTALQRTPPGGGRAGLDNGGGFQGAPGDAGLSARIVSGAGVGTATGPDGARVALTADQLTRLAAVRQDQEPVDIDLGGSLGDYRVMAGRELDGDLRVVGLAVGPQQRTIAALTLVILLGSVAGLVAMWLLGMWLVRRNLRPLRRVAETATRVSMLPLSSGEVALPERVAEVDTDPRTEVGQVGAALNGLLEHVDNALTARHRSEQRVRQFVADASHELRTPLASIRGYAELSRRERDPVPESVSHAMGRIESEAKRMGSLVEDLLLLARLDSGRPLERTAVDLSQMVVDAVSDAHAAAPEHRWELDLPDEPVEVVGDRGRLHQVVVNLLANARTHTPAGTRIRTGLAREAGWVKLTVSDNGPGVPVELRPHVFERFARGDTSRNRAGGSTGLGLSIVSAVVAAHGGRVELSTRTADPAAGSPGETTFSVLLPTGAVAL